MMTREADDRVDREPPTASTHPFRDRTAAGERLAERLQTLLARPCVIAAIPRGGVAVALPIVERLQRPLAIVHACKLTSPTAPELAFGALDEDGHATIDRETVTRLNLGAKDIESVKVRVGAEIERRISLYKARPPRPVPTRAGRNARGRWTGPG